MRNAGYVNLIKKINQARQCFIFLHYHHDLTAGALAEWTLTLQELANTPPIQLTLMTDYSQEFCSNNLAHLPINLIAENGAYIRFQTSSAWQSTGDLEEFTSIIIKLIPVLESYTQYVPGSHIEQKPFALTWHYGATDIGLVLNRQFRHNLSQMLEKASVEFIPKIKPWKSVPCLPTKSFYEFSARTFSFSI